MGARARANEGKMETSVIESTIKLCGVFFFFKYEGQRWEESHSRLSGQF